MWGAISGALFSVSILLASVALWNGLVLDIDKMTLSEAADAILGVNKMLIAATSSLMAAAVFYLIAAYKQAKRSSEEPEEQSEKPSLTLILPGPQK